MTWWRSAVIYQIYPRSFADSNGDGVGDLRGIIEHLDYVAWLGVDAVWLSPFYPSPQNDAGYDVSDPRAVDPLFGTLDDARELIASAHARNLRVIVDVVPNHSSNEREWFQQALTAERGSVERARYHFRDGRGAGGSEPPTNWVSWFGGSAWERITEPDGSAGQWYLHTFDVSQPDLNYTSPEVVEDALNTLRFWLDLGVDGFRVDVALGLCKDPAYPDLDDPEGLVRAMRADLDDGSVEFAASRERIANSAVLDRDEVHDIYRGWRNVLNEYPGERMAVCEAWVPPHRAAQYVAPDTLHQIFNFDFMVTPWNAQRLCTVVNNTLAGLANIGAPPTWALSNHDSPRVVSRLGGGQVGLERARALAVIAHALPGSLYIYQGEELGLSDVDLPDSARCDPVFFRTLGEQKGRDGARVPMPWQGTSVPYGFSESATTWLPMPTDWDALTVSAQRDSESSTLQLYRELLRLRRQLTSESTTQCVVTTTPEGLLMIKRSAERDAFVCVANITDDERCLTGVSDILIASDTHVRLIDTQLRLPPNAAAWVRTNVPL